MAPLPRRAVRFAAGVAAVCIGTSAWAQPAANAPGPDAARRIADSLASRAVAWRAAPVADRPVFRGVVSYDSAGGGTGQMLYPAPGVAGLLVAVLTHAAINESVRSAETKRIEDAADEVLQPFTPVIEKLTWQELQQSALARLDVGAARRLVPAGESAADAWVIDAQPVFRMTQDRRALVAEAVVRVFDADAQAPVAERAVRVVSPSVTAQEAEAYWRADAGMRLHETSAALAAEAIRAALLDIQAAPDQPQRTVRFREGTVDRFERAMPVDERCGRVVLRTLRGGVMSVPSSSSTRADEGAQPVACSAAWPAPGQAFADPVETPQAEAPLPAAGASAPAGPSGSATAEAEPPPG